MNDCPNVDVRDLLPDLINGRLDGVALRMAEAHVESCADCRAELALLRDVRASVRRTPVVDVAAIAAALPAYRAPARRSWVGWRVAAAITVVAAGASSLVVTRPGTGVDTAAAARPVVVARADTAASPAVTGDSAVAPAAVPSTSTPRADTDVRVVAGASTTVSSGRELAMAGGALTDLSDRELAMLLKEIESMDALPTLDVESASVAPLSPRGSAP